jgi:16S rRNA (cytosine1402-N4)-methyltransferase
MTDFHQHIPVLLTEAVEALAIRKDGIYIDGTLGRGGHSEAILKALGPQGRLIAIDKDVTAVKYGTEKFAHDSRCTVVHGSFADMINIAKQHDVYGKVDGILLDLGVSSPQFDDAARGFSFQHDGALDMRMNQEQKMDATKWLQHASEEEIARVLFEYGEERYSRRLAKAIVSARSSTAITRTHQLAEIIKVAHPKWEKHRHPATRSFQAIRIFINSELDDLKQVLNHSIELLKIGGRVAAISFHSLEDRMVKQFIQLHERGGDFPRNIPISKAQLSIQLKRIGKAITPSDSEVKINVRSRSATLRVAERV